MRALITGGRGFVGGWLSEHLAAQGDDVVVIDLEVDVTDAAAVGPAVADAAPDAIYHLAALSHVGQSWDSPAEVYRVNVLGTAMVLAAARAAGTDPVTLVISSAEVYGSVTPGDLPIDEGVPPAPVTPYAASKAAAEQVALQAWRGYGQRVVVVRPFNHIGPRQSSNFAVSALARRVVEARRDGSTSIRVGTLTTRRDFTDVRDVVRAYRLLATRGEAGSVVNVCSGHDVSVAEVAERLLALSGAQLDLAVDQELVRPVDVPVLRGDPQRIEQQVGWKPEFTLDDTLASVLAYWESEVSPGA